MNKSYERKVKGELYGDTSHVRKIIIFALTASVLVANILIIYSPLDSKIVSSYILQLLASAATTSVSILIVYRQKIDGLIGKAFAFLAAGFVLYFVAEVVRSYIEIGLGIENPLLSISYALWLGGYCSFFYFVFKMYNLLWASHSRTHQISVGMICIAFLIYIIISISGTAELSTPEGMISFLIPVTFLTLDIALLIPTALILLNPKKGPLTPIPWFFTAVILLTIGDVLLVYTYNVSSAKTLSWLSSLFFITAYLTAAAGLFWHNRFFIVRQKEKKIKYKQNQSESASWPIGK
jgi:hypothetical protein